MKFSIQAFLFFCGTFFALAPAQANVIYSANTETELVSDYSTVSPGQSVYVAIRMSMDPHWHVYWRNPGDSGIPPRLTWDVPEGVAIGKTLWPEPERIPLDPLMTYGYHDQVLLLHQFQIDSSYDQSNIPIKLNMEYLACQIECVPGFVDLELNLNVGPTPQKNPYWSQEIAQTINKLPREAGLNVQFIQSNEEEYLLRWQGRFDEKTTFYFYPYRGDLLDHFAPQSLNVDGNWFELKLRKSEYHPDQVEWIEGILYSSTGFQADFSQKTMYVSGPVQEPKPTQKSLWIALFFAFIGGVILNLMPCVLPVLSIKILNVVQQKEKSRSAIVRDGFLFSFGILAAFWALAFALILFQKAGAEIGWGFQFQSPIFVMMMIILFLTLALNLFGFFEIGLSLTRVNFRRKPGVFWEGVLTTIVATPCTAPFMGSALAYALTQSPPVTFLVFTFLGMGLAAPFLLAVLYPPLLKALPKPGPWMIHLKRFFGCLFLLTVAWLVWILSLQISIPFISAPPAVNVEEGIEWEKFSPEKIEVYRQSNQVVFLDFTARWCLTCQVNERLALSDKKVLNKFEELNVITMKADWTNYDKEITQALEHLGRNSIPLYVLYPKNNQEPILLPELLTPNIVIEHLNQLSN